MQTRKKTAHGFPSAFFNALSTKDTNNAKGTEDARAIADSMNEHEKKSGQKTTPFFTLYNLQ